MNRLKQAAQLCLVYRKSPSGAFTILNRRTAYLMRTLGLNRKDAWNLAQSQMDALCVRVALQIKAKGVYHHDNL